MTSEIRVNKINNRAGLGTVEYTPTGIIVSGIVTAYEFDGNFDTTPGIVITGIGTAQSLDVDDFVDVGSNIKLGNAGVVTATTFSTSNVDVTTDKIVVGTGVTIEANQVATGQATFTGIVTASSFRGDGSQLTGIVGGAMTAYNNSNHNNVTTFIAGYEAGEDIQKQNSDGNSSIGNILIGDRAGYKAQNAYDYNIAIGPYAHDNSDGGTTNISIGRNANSNNNQNASNVISIGYQTLNSFSNNGQNCVIGHRAARFLQSGTNNLVLGQNAEPSATAMSNEITLGDGNISHFRIPGIGVSFGNNGAVIAGVVTATSFSGDGSNLSNLPASAPVGGASTNTVFFENDKVVAVNYQITSTKNAMSAGPIAINAGIAVTVPSGCTWTIV